ncbi:Ribosomal protein S12 methylthiotransferase [Frankliniella fusca]|uniref:Ribosomal protein S12 methylthiotransferase n=1 Tax=Frankliniella fusca TaxID=407009 RepID=A0AAE1L8R2_9NEOP|nr:Ribosomal protein S12 methylthiotransferase [Frankliniella fusca]
MGDQDEECEEMNNSEKVVEGNQDNEQSDKDKEHSAHKLDSIPMDKNVDETSKDIAMKKFYDDNKMWVEIMEAMRTMIDDHIIRLLHMCGFKTYAALKQFEEEDFKEIEAFVRSGSLEERVPDAQELKLYLGSATSAKSFAFFSGEKKLVRQVVQYVNKNHTEKDKPLGKSVTMHPLFKKNSANDAGNPKRRKTSEDNVLSYDFPEEETYIKKLLKDYFKKQKFTQDYITSVSRVTMTIKTVEKNEGPVLIAQTKCLICSENISGYRSASSSWTLSNIYRHFMKHKEKKDHLPGTVLQSFFQPGNEKSDAAGTETRNSEEEDGGDLIEMEESNKSGFLGGGRYQSSDISPNTKKFSRADKRKRALGRHIENQTRIPVYFPVLNEIEITLKANSEIISCLEARCKELSPPIGDSNKMNLSFLLKLLMDTAQKNSERKNHGQRYEEDLKLFAVYLFVVGGRMIYEFLQVNLPGSLPSISQVELMLKNASQPVIEGVFRFQELVDFLMKNNLPLKVAISEDGTRVQEKFCYDSTTNQIIGPVLALNDDGIPIPSSHPATSAAMIASHLRNGRVASNGYAIMAQPLQKGAPSFCLTLFGTDNKFSAVHISKRWNFIHKELGKLGVEVINFASDGDPKLLKAMHAHLFGQSGGCTVSSLA